LEGINMSENRKITRRQFLQIVAISGAAGLAVKLGLDNLDASQFVSETRFLMGTVINLKVAGPDPKAASAAIRACLDRMATLEAVLSRFQAESQLSRLNRDGFLADADPSLLAVVQRSQELSQLTAGAFDITVKPVLDLYQAGPDLPGEDEVQRTLALVDFRKIDLHDRTIRFQKMGMSVTVDGIAKGFIVDEGVAVLNEYGFTNVMVEAGGDLMAMGEKTSHTPWKVGLQAPRDKIGNLMATFRVQNKALATSGDYMQAFTQDFSNHHIIDPRTGRSSPELASVTIMAPTVTLADGLATAVMVMGTKGFSLIEDLPTCEAYVVTKDSIVLKTTGFGEG
jgi:thiamine biosynthesis lipoprotein